MNYRDSAQEWAIRHRWMHSGHLSTLADIMEMPKHVLSNPTNDGNHLLDLLGHYLQSFVVCVDKWRDSHPIFPCHQLMRYLNSFLILPSQPTTIGMTCPMHKHPNAASNSPTTLSSPSPKTSLANLESSFLNFILYLPTTSALGYEAAEKFQCSGCTCLRRPCTSSFQLRRMPP